MFVISISCMSYVIYLLYKPFIIFFYYTLKTGLMFMVKYGN
nr:MAG TPA: hypothetical protein [Caudoviricetes sp.]